jgi:hypothetical protein
VPAFALEDCWHLTRRLDRGPSTARRLVPLRKATSLPGPEEVLLDGVCIKQPARLLTLYMGQSDGEASHACGQGIRGRGFAGPGNRDHFREAGNTGTHTHVQQLRRYFEGRGITATLVTPFPWSRPLT